MHSLLIRFSINKSSFICLFCFTAYQPHQSFNQVKENQSEKKFKGEVLRINDNYQFVFFIRSLFVGNHDKRKRKKICETG